MDVFWRPSAFLCLGEVVSTLPHRILRVIFGYCAVPVAILQMSAYYVAKACKGGTYLNNRNRPYWEEPEIEDWDDDDDDDDWEAKEFQTREDRQVLPFVVGLGLGLGFGCNPRRYCNPRWNCNPRWSCRPRQFCRPRQGCYPWLCFPL